VIEKPNDEKWKLLLNTSAKLWDTKQLRLNHQIHSTNFNNNLKVLYSLWDKYYTNEVSFHSYLNNTITIGFQSIEYIDKILNRTIDHNNIISFCYALRNHIVHNGVLDLDFVTEDKNVILDIKKIQSDEKRFKSQKEKNGIDYIEKNKKKFDRFETYGGIITSGLFIHNIINDFAKEVNDYYDKYLQPECIKLENTINKLTQESLYLGEEMQIKNINQDNYE
jgi:hypothetical protein